MRRADRLFDIIQTLRTAPGPLTGAMLADKLEVTVRTIYRDIAALQASRVPIEGAAGLGYVLRRGFDLPPLEGRRTDRTIWPLAMAYYVDVSLIGAWCELRNDFRHFRVDRISAFRLLDEQFPEENGELIAAWLALQKQRSADAIPR